MDFDDLKNLYLKKREQFGVNMYKHISELLIEAKELHHRDWLEKILLSLVITSKVGELSRAKTWRDLYNILLKKK